MSRLRLIVINVAVSAALLCLIEGGLAYASLTSFLITSRAFSGFAETRYTEYDPRLGWINRPSVTIPDMYGPGVSLTTNAQRFRGERDVAAAVAPGRIRIICSGDSFTFGYGVSNADAWCRQLEGLDPRLEAVNMGQGGYGLDQAHLWYERDAAAVQHHIQLLAFIEDDIFRAVAPERRQSTRPILALDGGALRVMNEPVDEFKSRRELFLSNAARVRTFKLLWSIQAGLGLDRRAALPGPVSLKEQRALLARLFARARELNQERSSTLVVVHLPMEHETAPSDWLRFVERELKATDVPFVKLLPDFLALTPDASHAMFIQSGEVDYAGSEGHYNAKGNAFVARALYERIKPYLEK